MRLYPGAAAAVRALNDADLPVVLITNQSGVARGLFGEADVERVHRRLESLLAEQGARLTGVHACPHHPEAPLSAYRLACECRKPAPGLLLRAAADHDLDLGTSWMVGDAGRDLEAGRRAGVSGLVLVATGKGADERRRLEAEGLSDFAWAEDLGAAAAHILAQGR